MRIRLGGPTRAVAVLSVLGLLLAGCSGDDAEGDRPAGGDPTGDDAGRLTAWLATLPQDAVDQEEPLIQVAIADLDRAAALAGMRRPAGSTDPAVVGSYVDRVSGVAGNQPQVSAVFPETSQFLRVHQVAEFAAELGWSLADVSWFAEYQSRSQPFAALGGVDEARLTEVLGPRPEDGIWRIGGDDYTMNLVEASPARPLGEALRLAMVDDHLVIARGTPPVQAALGGGPTLAEHPILSALAEVMDAEDAYSAQFLVGPPSEFQHQPRTPEQEEAQVLPRVFTGVGAGTAMVDGTGYGLFVYTHLTEEDAAANAEAVREILTEGGSMYTDTQWRERLAVDEVRVDGTIVIARVTFLDTRPVLIYQILFQRDNLVTLA